MLRDRCEGESMIVPGEKKVHGTTFTKYSDTVLGWYKVHVESDTVVHAWYTHPVTFINCWRDCYVAHIETKRVYQNEWQRRSMFVPVEDWNVKAKVADFEFVDISLIEFEVEDPKPIKSECTLVRPGVSVTVTDESIYVSQAMVDEWNYDQAMKVL